MRIYQEYLPGQEYTIDVLLTDKTKIIVPRKRVNVKGGNSTCGKIELNRDIITFLQNFFEDSSFRGPLCVQMKEDKDGVPKLTEINPRFGGGSIFTTIAGINFIDVILAEKFGDKLELEEPREITITRYWDEMEL
jgi:carbamoyl-phosphate synthase large subunit